MSRLQKYKSLKKKKLVLMSKVVVAFYLVIFSFSYLTGGTIAYFSNSNQGYVNLTAGTWFDGSILQFAGKNKGTIVTESCSAIEISADFKNVGHKMQGPAKYEIYYSETENKGKGSPGNHGSSIYKGEFNALDKNEVITLSYEAQKEGFYVFKVYQREGFEPKGNNKAEILSNKFQIQCKEDNEVNKNSEEKEQETVTSEEAVDEASQPEEQINEEEAVDESANEPVESDPPQQDQPEDKNNQSNEQNDNAAEDVPEDNTNEETSKEGAASTNNQPAGEGESNEETD